jgi:5-methyltetrahydropteroyltriglutamate--homocysteine methyltransferase
MGSGSPHIRLSSTGSYPRAGENPESQLLEKTVASFDRGERTSADLLDAQNTVTRRAIADQVRAGLEIVTDGQIRWNDPISHLAAKIDNVELRGALPFFDTGRNFRQPICTGTLLRRGTLIVDEYSFARNALGHLPTPPEKAGKLAIKPVLTGPYTLAKLSESESHTTNGASKRHSHLEDRATAFAEILANEVDALARAGAHLVQFDEPAILAHPQDWPIFAAAIEHLLESRDKKKPAPKLDLALYTYFGDAQPLYEKFITLPVDILGFDFATSPALADRIADEGSPKSLALGFIDGRNSKMEASAEVARKIDRLLAKISGKHVLLGTSCGLEYLTADIAFAKLALLPVVLAEISGTPKP